MENFSNNNRRIEVVDALRGFAVLAILLLHNIEHFIYPVYPQNLPSWVNTLDTGVSNIIFTLFAGKAYAIFSLLFGFTFYLQFEKMRLKGGDFGYRFLWRLVGLALFATLNAAFFPGGDVLLLYAAMGIVLFVVRHWSSRAILAAAIFFTLQPMEWLYYIMSIFDSSFQLPDYGVSAMYDRVSEICESGSVWEFLWCNITLGQKASLMWAVGAGRLLQTAGLFLIGFYIGKRGLFAANEKNIRFWTYTLVVSAILFAPLLSLRNMIMEGSALQQQTVGVAFDMWQKLTFTFVLVSSFVLLYQKESFRKSVQGLTPYGRMSLTNYVTQSIMGAFVYFPLGLHLAPYCGSTVSLLIALLMFFVQMLFSRWWMKSHRQGPLEALWYKWTWGCRK